MKVLLLNPPGKRTYIRDYFCSKTTKSNYLFHPIDLVVLSGTIAAQHEVQALDCIAEELSPAEAEALASAPATSGGPAGQIYGAPRLRNHRRRVVCPLKSDPP